MSPRFVSVLITESLPSSVSSQDRSDEAVGLGVAGFQMDSALCPSLRNRYFDLELLPFARPIRVRRYPLPVPPPTEVRSPHDSKRSQQAAPPQPSIEQPPEDRVEWSAPRLDCAPATSSRRAP